MPISVTWKRMEINNVTVKRDNVYRSRYHYDLDDNQQNMSRSRNHVYLYIHRWWRRKDIHPQFGCIRQYLMKNAEGNLVLVIIKYMYLPLPLVFQQSKKLNSFVSYKPLEFCNFSFITIERCRPFVYIFKRENLSLFCPESRWYPDQVMSETREKTKDQRKQIAIFGDGGWYQWTK